jgi:4-hydroxy-tetrahydrodipicolinate reductase
MGRAVRSIAENSNELRIAAMAEYGDEIAEPLKTCDVVIDFSHADATADVCSACVGAVKPLVTGTTGRSSEQEHLVADAARTIPIIAAPNFSVGVNALFWLTRKAAELLGPEFDLEIFEAHHRLKKDAPSGTAKRLAEILCEARGLSYDADVVHGRKGLVGERSANEIGMHAIRGGDVVGDHTVIFSGRGERVELSHKASSRETFAAGALRAARWIIGKPPGSYSMEDVLGLSR